MIYRVTMFIEMHFMVHKYICSRLNCSQSMPGKMMIQPCAIKFNIELFIKPLDTGSMKIKLAAAGL